MYSVTDHTLLQATPDLEHTQLQFINAINFLLLHPCINE